MKTWLDLEARFRALAPALKSCRLDAQWGAAGEFWSVSGVVDTNARQEFELLCGVGGRFLEKSYSAKNPEHASLLAISDPKIRWYTLLKQFGQFRDMIYGEQRNADGSTGMIYSASLPSAAVSCANLCLALQVQHPITERESKWKWFHDNYGKAIVIGLVLTLVAAAIKVLTG